MAVAKFKANVEPIPEGTYNAICYASVDIGTQYNVNFKKSEHKVILIFELDGTVIEVDGEKKRRVISKTYSLSLNKKSSLYKHVRPLLAREFTPEEIKNGYDTNNLVGLPCMISVTNETSDDGTVYSNIGGINPLMVGLQPITPENELIRYDMGDNKLMEKLPEWIQEKIKNSAEYKSLFAGSEQIDIKPRAENVQQPTNKAPF